MGKEETEIDKMTEGLNNNRNIQNIVLDNLDNSGLTESKKNFIKTYRPEKSLIIYGTLAPNRPNHSVVEHIKGKWHKGIVKGKLANECWGAKMSYYGFKHTSKEDAEEIEAFILFSDELVSNWQMLDGFEGDGYQRILTKYKLENGQSGVGYIYAINEEKR